MKRVYKKLVRDKITDIIKRQGREPVFRVLDDKEYVEKLIDKLCEEVDEFDQDRNADEMADIIEVLNALMDALRMSPAQLKKSRRKKALTRGVFKKRIYLEKVIESE